MDNEGIRVKGEEPTEEDMAWLNYGHEMLKESPKVLDENAKSLVALGSSLLTVFTGLVALFKLNERKVSSPIDWALIVIPIVFWLLSISYNAYVNFPGRYRLARDSPTDIIKTTEVISKRKYNRLKVGAVLFIIALGTSSFSIVWPGAQAPSQSTQAQTVQFVVPEDEIAALQNMSIPFEENTQRTVPIILLERRNETYLVRVPEGSEIEFDKDLVKGIVYD